MQTLNDARKGLIAAVMNRTDFRVTMRKDKIPLRAKTPMGDKFHHSQVIVH